MEKRKYMERALFLAKEAAKKGEVPVGAVVVKNGKIIGEGQNRREKEKTPLAHAELEALHNAAKTLGDWRLSGCELYVTLEPCAMCGGAIITSRLKRLVFGAYDETAGGVISHNNMFFDFENKVQIIGGYMENECKKVLEDFFEKLR